MLGDFRGRGYGVSGKETTPGGQSAFGARNIPCHEMFTGENRWIHLQSLSPVDFSGRGVLGNNLK
jgi:hypothetical protein